jgi:hypothetical protein
MRALLFTTGRPLRVPYGLFLTNSGLILNGRKKLPRQVPRRERQRRPLYKCLHSGMAIKHYGKVEPSSNTCSRHIEPDRQQNHPLQCMHSAPPMSGRTN